jgi:hypothetical protein
MSAVSIGLTEIARLAFRKGKMVNMTKEEVIGWLSSQPALEIASLVKDLETKRE